MPLESADLQVAIKSKNNYYCLLINVYKGVLYITAPVSIYFPYFCKLNGGTVKSRSVSISVFYRVAQNVGYCTSFIQLLWYLYYICYVILLLNISRAVIALNIVYNNDKPL